MTKGAAMKTVLVIVGRKVSILRWRVGIQVDEEQEICPEQVREKM